MNSKRESLILLIAVGVMVLLIQAPLAEGQPANVFIDPDTSYVFTGPGAQFQIDIRVDANAESLKIYFVYLSFDKNICSVDSVAQGALLLSGGPSVCGDPPLPGCVWEYTASDSSSIAVHDGILGAGLAVDGPGVLATVFFKCTGAGTTYFVIDSVLLIGVESIEDTIPSTSTDGIAFVNVPPDPFDLIGPPDSSEYKPHENPEDSSIMLDWEDAETVYPGDTILYTLEYSTSENFHPDSTDSVENINGSEYELYIDTFTVTSLIYWRVKAFDIYDLKTWSNPPNLRFIVITYICGDVDGNTLINASDVIFLAMYYFGRPGFIPPVLDACEVNLDGKINLGDAVYLARYLFASGPPPCQPEG